MHERARLHASKATTVTGIIPARMGSSRFLGKPLATIDGLSMIEHVYRRAALCRMLDRLAVATPDAEILEAVRGFGGEAIVTSSAHERATDRVAEAAQVTGGDVVVVIQGDEPLVRPEMIEAAVEPVLREDDVFCVNLVALIERAEEFLSPNTVKVTMDHRGNALYFSRAPIPSPQREGFAGIRAYKQVCVIPFRRENLLQFSSLPPTPLERAESIDMLRVLEHGYRVRLVPTPFRTLAVDEPADVPVVEAAMRADPLRRQY